MSQPQLELKLPAILVAMAEELTPFLSPDAVGNPESVDAHSHSAQAQRAQAQNLQSDDSAKRIAGSTFRKTELDGRPVLLVTTGIGLVNAAMAATLAVTQFGADALISSGSAGGVGADVRVGDVVVATETCYSTADATAFTNYALGQIPQMPPRFIADYSAVELVETIELSAGCVHKGLILSSDAFIWEKNYADYVGKFPDALATDMETTAIGQVAYQFGLPWISVRGISDLCGPQGADDFYTHLDGAANIAADVVKRLLAQNEGGVG